MINKILRAAALAGGLLVPGVAAAAVSAIVTTDLNIRTGPGVNYQDFGTIPAGGHVTVYGCANGYNWCDVGWSGTRGWVSSNFLAYRQGGYDGSIGSIGISIGVPVIGFDPYVYHDRYYTRSPWYNERYIRREIRQDRREDRREVRRDRRDDRQDIRQEKRDVKKARGDVRDARQRLREARRDGENTARERNRVERIERRLRRQKSQLDRARERR